MTSLSKQQMKCPHCGADRPFDLRATCPSCQRRVRDAAPAKVKRAAPMEISLQDKDLVVIASDPNELVIAQNQMIARVDAKIAAAKEELADLAGIQLAPELDDVQDETIRGLVQRSKATLEERSKRLITGVERRVFFLERTRAALAAGYAMVPNMPGHVIAIRTNRKKPLVHDKFEVSHNSDVDTAKADPALSPGEGKYVSPTPLHVHQRGESKQDIYVEGWNEAIDLPVEFLKPEVLHRTAKALELKIFDEVVLVRDTWRNSDTYAGQDRTPRGRDPMVVGRVVYRRGPYASDRRVLSFLIAWFMDTALI